MLAAAGGRGAPGEGLPEMRGALGGAFKFVKAAAHGFEFGLGIAAAKVLEHVATGPSERPLVEVRAYRFEPPIAKRTPSIVGTPGARSWIKSEDAYGTGHIESGRSVPGGGRDELPDRQDHREAFLRLR